MENSIVFLERFEARYAARELFGGVVNDLGGKSIIVNHEYRRD